MPDLQQSCAMPVPAVPDMTPQPAAFRISVAPMMDWTTRDYRYFARLLSPDCWLYTEMVTTGAILHGQRQRFLDFDPAEQPLVLQLGGSQLQELAACTELAEAWRYREVNLNVGCPSDRVQHNRIGACLMAEPDWVAECVATMQQRVAIPVTVKHRIGIDDLNDYGHLRHFVDTVAQAGCRRFIVHARIALLNGLSPKENREVPPLRYADVYRLKQERPDLIIEINGGFTECSQILAQQSQVDGVMIGRAAYHQPYLLAELAEQLWQQPLPDRLAIAEQFLPYLAQRVAAGAPVHAITRHILGLFAGQPGARRWRQLLSGAGVSLSRYHEALAYMAQQTTADLDKGEAGDRAQDKVATA